MKMQKTELIRAIVELVQRNILKKDQGYELIQSISLDSSNPEVVEANGTKTIVHTKNRKWFWTEEEKQFMKDNAGKMSITKMAEKVGKTPYATSNQFYTIMRLSNTKKTPTLAQPRRESGFKRTNWTDEQIQFIKDNNNNMTIHDMAKHLEKPYGTVNHMIYDKLKLKKTNQEGNKSNRYSQGRPGSNKKDRPIKTRCYHNGC